MCRWLAYSGPPIFLNTVLFSPKNSLIRQSLQARESHSVTNGDGFGVGWYQHHDKPGLFRDIHPAWNDQNLRNLSEQIQARTFLAHVRSSTGTPTARPNCHPFRYQNYLFMHNGQIGQFEKVHRDLMFAVRPDLFTNIKGTTDSELFFHLLLGNDLNSDIPAAFAATIKIVEEARQKNNVTEPFLLTAVLSDGETLYAVRYATNNKPASLYLGSALPLSEFTNSNEKSDEKAILILSEPLDDIRDNWTEVPENSVVVAAENRAYIVPLPADD
jgi:predicted glutamine amidotransferase